MRDMMDILSIESRNLTEVEISGLLRGVVGGLIYLHENHKIHRDIKPDNILVNRYTEIFHLIPFDKL